MAGENNEGIYAVPDQEPFLHGLFQDNMVLCRNRRGNIFGWAQPGTTVSVTLQLQSNGELVSRSSTETNMNGVWQVRLGQLNEAVAMSGPLQLTAEAPDQRVTRRNILVGEVWLVAGQSNVAYALGDITRQSSAFKQRAIREIETADNDNLRLFQLPRNSSATRLTNVAGGAWNISTPACAEIFSALGYLLGGRLQRSLKVPIGIIEADLGGSKLADWLPAGTTDGIPGFPDQLNSSANIYNAMLHVLGAEQGGIDVAGAVWCQGESDAGLTTNSQTFSFYRQLLEAHLVSLRRVLGTSELAVVIMQLAGFVPRYAKSEEPFLSNVNHWPSVREAQRKVALSDAKAHLVTTIDLGKSHVVHFPNKWDAADRAYRQILNHVYNQGTVATGPTPTSFERLLGNKVRVTFDNVSSGLRLSSKRPRAVRSVKPLPGTRVNCFELQSAVTGNWQNVTAALQSPSVVDVDTIPGVTHSAIRYMWYDDPIELECNLYSTARLPTPPFSAPLAPV